MAATDEFTITIKGRGGHAAQPHRTIDPIVIGAQIVTNLQMIASRTADPLRSVVVSVTKFNAGFAHNVIPNDAQIAGTIRTLDPEVRDMAESRLKQIVNGLAAAHGAEADIGFHRNYPVTVNHAQETAHAVATATDIAGAANVNPEIDPMMGGEDFSYMLNARPGAFIFIGNGDTAGLHNPAYDFNDEAIAHGISYWVRLAEQRLGA
jgi:hippurate hydrolase